MYFSKTFSEVLEEKVNPQLKKIKYLTPSERTILRMIAQDNSSKKIALKLSISIRTVEKHRSNIINKLDLSFSEASLSSWVRDNKELILSL
nr:helix-turn-helix transcriptional regulator [Salegentibacter sp. BLCTC]